MPPKEPKEPKEPAKRRTFKCPKCKGLPAEFERFGKAKNLSRHLEVVHRLTKEEAKAFIDKHNEELHFKPPEDRGQQRWCMLCNKRYSKLTEHLMGKLHGYKKHDPEIKYYNDLATQHGKDLKKQMREGGGGGGDGDGDGQDEEDADAEPAAAAPPVPISKKPQKTGKLMIKTFLSPCKTGWFSEYLESEAGKRMTKGAPYATHVTIILNTIYANMTKTPVINPDRGRPRLDAITNVEKGLYENQFTYKNIHDHWYNKLYKRGDDDVGGPNPHTIKLRLESLWKFIMFLEYIGREKKTIIKEAQYKPIQIDIKQYIGGLSRRLKLRGTEIQEESRAKAPTLKEIDTFFRSDYVRGIKTLINNHKNKRCEISSSFVKVRNYLMTQLLFDNAQRPAPIVHLTVKEFEAGARITKDASGNAVTKDFGVRLVDASTDKTLHIYGKVKLVVRDELYDFLKIYLLKFRPHNLDNDYLFVTAHAYNGKRVSTTLLHNAVQEIWKKVHPNKNLTATSIRKVTVTAMFHYNPELGRLLAKLMGHSSKTQASHYDMGREATDMAKMAKVLHGYHQNPAALRGKKRGRPSTQDEAAVTQDEAAVPQDFDKERDPLTLSDPAKEVENTEFDEIDGYVDDEYLAGAVEGVVDDVEIAAAAGPGGELVDDGVVDDGEVAGPSGGIPTTPRPQRILRGTRRAKNVVPRDSDSSSDDADTYADTYADADIAEDTDADIAEDTDTIADPDSDSNSDDKSYKPPPGKKMKVQQQPKGGKDTIRTRERMDPKHSHLLSIHLNDMIESGILPTDKVRERIKNTLELHPLLKAYNADTPKYQAHIKCLSGRIRKEKENEKKKKKR